MKLSVGLRVANRLSLTPQLQQAIRLLQLSSLELQQEVQQQLEQNPLLEEELEQVEIVEKETDQSEVELDVQFSEAQIPEEMAVDTDWDTVYSYESYSSASSDVDLAAQFASSLSLQQHLMQQLTLLKLSELDRLVAHCIIDALDEKGYLAETLDAITEQVNQLIARLEIDLPLVELAEVVVVLKQIQHLDPTGVAARDLAECLSLQLAMLKEHVPYKAAARILIDHLDLLLEKNAAQKLIKCGMHAEDIDPALSLIKSFNPAPGSAFSQTETNFQIPDVIVSLRKNQWLVQLNPDILPKLRVNQHYTKHIAHGDQSEQNQYLRACLSEARQFIRSVDERHHTLLRVASCIAQHQRDFFEQGSEAMRPLILKAVADELSLHESTISRVTNNKYMLTPHGLFELKYFFSSQIAAISGENISSTAIRAMIKKLVANENPRKPLSDQALCRALEEKGVSVARRTVAKYRELLHIASSSQRKRNF